MVKRCLIIDDSEEIIYSLSSVLSSFPFLEILSEVSFESALDVLLSKKVDLIILDVDLGGKNGLNLLKFLSVVPPTIVISSSPEYAAETYTIDNVASFLKKPVNYGMLTAKVSDILSLKMVKTGFIGKDYCLLKIGPKMTKLDFHNIDYIEGYGMYSKIHHENKILVGSESMSSMENSLPAGIFKRIHKSFIVNLTKITNINHKSCTINDKIVPIGYSYKPALAPLIKSFKTLYHSQDG